MFADRLKELRTEYNWTQIELGERLAFNQQQIARWESGAALPRAETLVTLAKLFDVSVDYMLGVTSERKPSGGAILSLTESAILDAMRRGQGLRAIRLMLAELEAS